MITVTKPKLPKGLSYPLKTSMIEAILTEIPVDCDVSLTYWTPQSGGSVLEAHYWLLNQRRPTTVYLRVGAVPSPQRRAVQELLVEHVLPAFAEWLRIIASLPDDSPTLYTEPYFNAEYIDGRMRISRSPNRESTK